MNIKISDMQKTNLHINNLRTVANAPVANVCMPSFISWSGIYGVRRYFGKQKFKRLEVNDDVAV